MKKSSIFRLTLLSLFTAIMLVMDFTPLGYITTGLFSITLMTLPVAIGAICLGPSGGAFLGAIFGLTSFLQCFGIGYFIDPSGAILFETSPFATIVTCFLPRILAGLAAGFIFKLFERKLKTGILSFAVTSGAVSLLNTLLFMSCFVLLFQGTILAGKSIMAVFLSVLTLNLIIEISVTLVVGSAVGRALYQYLKRLAVKKS